MSDFRELVDLAGERLGGAVLYASDEFFAERENLIKPEKPVWKEHDYTTRGKWMDGWESRRKRESGHDFALIRLGAPGVVRGVVVDTSFFRGNYPESCSISALNARPETDVQTLLSSSWTEILPRSSLKGDTENLFAVEDSPAVTHLRFDIFPDGGVARLRVHGQVVPDWRRLGGLAGEIDLAAVEHGGEVLQCSDMFFGPKHNLIMPGHALNMSDGWETRRRRGPGHDWVIVKLAIPGAICRIEVDTSHFKGNHPDTCSIDGKLGDGDWTEILPRTKLQPHTRHLFLDEIQQRGPFSHVRLNAFPDGGVARLRVYGSVEESARGQEVARRLDAMDATRAAAELSACCGSRAWVEQMVAARPFGNWEKLNATAERVWSKLGKEDLIQAFQSHPRIGEKGRGWSAQEQAGTRGANSQTISQLAEANREYEKRFGHGYLVCATGRSADEMLANLRERMKNKPEEELRVAAGEQQKITRLRLQKLVL